MGRKDQRPQRRNVNLDLPDALLAELDALARENRRTRTAEVVLALEKHLGIDRHNPTSEIMTKRRGFTLIEMLVVIAIIVALAALAAGFMPRVSANYRITDAASGLRVWLTEARNRAKRDGVVTGLRIVADDATMTTATRFVPIQQIAVAPDGVLISSAFDVASGTITLTFVGVDFTLGGLPANQWLVQPGDIFRFRNGTAHTVLSVQPNQLTFAALLVQGNFLGAPISGNYGLDLTVSAPTSNYSIQGIHPVLGEPGYQLPGDAIMDAALMAQYGVVLPVRVPGSWDVLFNPAGQVVSADLGRYPLWLRSSSLPQTEYDRQAIVMVPINGGDANVVGVGIGNDFPFNGR